MYIENIESIDPSKLYKCNKYIGMYLIEHGVPLIGISSDHKYCFASTDLTRSTLEKMPFYIKIYMLIN